MMVYEKAQGKIELQDQDFLAEGGEGRLYARGQAVYKIYHDPAHVIPTAKFDELQHLDHPSIIRPMALLTNAKQQPVGYSMLRAPHAAPLPHLFASSFRDQHGITPQMTVELVKSMQSVITGIHQKGFLMVDGNEFNYLVDSSNWVKPYFIDVDSWQTPSFKATAIMPSIRDYTVNGFSELTDWFSFAIVACQLFIGIHPFKGRHKDFGKGDFESRIKARLSVFNPEVSYPSSVRDFSVIPRPYYEWFMDLFEKGLRRPPPDGSMTVRVQAKQNVLRDGAFVTMSLIKAYEHALLGYKVWNGTPMGWFGSMVMVGNERFELPPATQGVILLMNHQPLFLGIESARLVARVGHDTQILPLNLNASRVLVVDNTAYVINGNQLIKLNVQQLKDRVLIAPGKVVRIMPHAHEVFAGMIVQYVMGKPYIIIPYKAGTIAQVAVPELKDYRIVEARYVRNVALIKAARRDGRYDLIRLRFNSDHSRHDVDIRQDYDETINFAVIDRGVTIQMVEEGKMEVFMNDPDYQDVRIIEDQQLHMDMQLFDQGGRLAAYQANHVVAVSLVRN